MKRLHLTLNRDKYKFKDKIMSSVNNNHKALNMSIKYSQ